MKDENELRQDFFITDDGYINIRLKVSTEDKEEREKLVYGLMKNTYREESLELSKFVQVDQLYFHNSNPISVLKELKAKMMQQIEDVFNDISV